MTSLETPPRTAAPHGLLAELAETLGPANVTGDLEARRRASVDGASMSPILSEQLPLGLPDVVAFPASAEEIAATVAVAARHRVPITTRGRGTGNYGQAIPLRGGVVLDTTRARAVTELREGQITAEAGAPLVQLERAAADTGQQLWMFPSTVHSSLGGFLAGGSGGTGTIAHGSTWDGFVTALDMAFPAQPGRLVHLGGEEAAPYLHTYGVGGIIARASVRLEPRQSWVCLYASFRSFHQALAAIRALGQLKPWPRLVSADPPGIAAALPADPAIPSGRASLRAILDQRTEIEAGQLVAGVGGRVEDRRVGHRAETRLSSLSYNHPIYWLQRAHSPQVYFHVEVAHEALIDRIDEVEAVYPGGMLHIEAAHRFPIGMLAAPYHNASQVLAGYPVLEQLGVRVHSPHQYLVDRHVEEIRAIKARVDPAGLLNPGKLP